MFRLHLPLLVLLALLTVGLASCRVREATPGPGSSSTRPAAVTAVAPVGPLSPTKKPAAPTAAGGPTAAAGPLAWTLTILHTGEVYGDVLPCG